MTALTMADKDRLDREAFSFIAGRLQTTAIPPSYTEIADALSLHSKASVKRIIDRLVAAGRLRQIPNRARAIEVIHTSPPSVPVVAYPNAVYFVWSDGDKALVPMKGREA